MVRVSPKRGSGASESHKTLVGGAPESSRVAAVAVDDGEDVHVGRGHPRPDSDGFARRVCFEL